MMNCEDYKELISLFMDNELDESRAADVRMHIAMCPDCARLCEDLSSILDVCHSGSPSEILPPNSQALWRRINNVIENEAKPAAAAAAESADAGRRRFWRLSLPQLAAAVLGIAVISSLLTIVGIRNYIQPTGDDFTTRSAATQTTFEKILSRVGLMETPQQARDRRVREQQSAIAYWNSRVQARRVVWDKNTRDAFDRNLQVIDEALNDYATTLERDPDDELSGEMLDSVLNDKMNLLRDFSDL